MTGAPRRLATPRVGVGRGDRHQVDTVGHASMTRIMRSRGDSGAPGVSFSAAC